MNTASYNSFECHMYVSPSGNMKFALPAESGPKKVARFVPIGYDKLVDPSFRRLLAAFESVPQPLQIVQV